MQKSKIWLKNEQIREEVLACRNNAALFDLSYFGKFYLCGPEVEKAADQLFVSDTKRPLNRTVYTAMLNKRGCVEADCTVTTIEAGSSGVVDPIFKGNALYVGEVTWSSSSTQAPHSYSSSRFVSFSRWRGLGLPHLVPHQTSHRW